MSKRRNRYHLEERIAVLQDWHDICLNEPDLLKRMVMTQRHMKVQQKVTEAQAHRFDKLMQETAKKVGFKSALVPAPAPVPAAIPPSAAAASTSITVTAPTSITVTVSEFLVMLTRGMIKETDKVTI